MHEWDKKAGQNLLHRAGDACPRRSWTTRTRRFLS